MRRARSANTGRWRGLALAALALLMACGDDGGSTDASVDGGAHDAGAHDAGTRDAGELDAGPTAFEDAEPPGADAGALLGEHRVFFVGNSYTARNDLAGRYAALAGKLSFERVTTGSRAPGGYQLPMHASDAATADTPLSDALMEPWDFVVVQEQSQIPGFPAGQPQRDAGLLAAVELAERAAAAGAVTVLYNTWGRRDGDPDNLALYPDFLTMQERLDAGYEAMAEAIREAGHPVRVAPVGDAFRVVFRDVEATGADPTTDSDFTALYAGDGSHPSLAGTYLAALVILRAAVGDAADAVVTAPDELDPAVAAYLRDVAARAGS